MTSKTDTVNAFGLPVPIYNDYIIIQNHKRKLKVLNNNSTGAKGKQNDNNRTITRVS